MNSDFCYLTPRVDFSLSFSHFSLSIPTQNMNFWEMFPKIDEIWIIDTKNYFKIFGEVRLLLPHPQGGFLALFSHFSPSIPTKNMKFREITSKINEILTIYTKNYSVKSDYCCLTLLLQFLWLNKLG